MLTQVPWNEDHMKHSLNRMLAAVLITFGLLVGTAVAATLGAHYPNLMPIG